MYFSLSGAHYTQTISRLLDQVGVVKRLAVLLDPIEDILKYVGASYGLDYAEHEFIRYYSNPQSPALTEILTHIKGTATPDNEERQTTSTLLQVLHYYFERGIGNKDSRIKEAMELLQKAEHQ